MSSPVTIEGSERHTLESQHVGDTFQIDIALPPGYASSDARYPVAYVLDGNAMFGMAVDTARLLQLGTELPPLIIVGIGYPVGDAIGQMLALRTRDLTPTADASAREGYGDIPGLPDEIPSGGAAPFLASLREELIPFVDATVRTDGQRTLIGDSLGGLFALYALFEAPETFGSYVAGSPSIWWGDRGILKLEASRAEMHTDLAARLFLSVGLLEEPGKDEPEPDDAAARARLEVMRRAKMVSNVRELEAALRERAYPGLELRTAYFDAETHSSVVPATISRGLREVLS